MGQCQMIFCFQKTSEWIQTYLVPIFYTEKMNCPTRSCGVSVGAYTKFLIVVYIARKNFASRENDIDGWVVAQAVSIIQLPTYDSNSLAFPKPKPNAV